MVADAQGQERLSVSTSEQTRAISLSKIQPSGDFEFVRHCERDRSETGWMI